MVTEIDSLRPLPARIMADYAGRRGNDLDAREIAILPEYEEEILDLGLGHSPFGSPEQIVEAIKQQEFSQAYTQAIAEYPNDRWSEQISNQVRNRFELNSDVHVSFHPGGSYGLLDDIFRKLVDWTPTKETAVIAVSPHFPNVALLAHMASPNGESNGSLPYLSLKMPLGTPYEERIKHLAENRRNDPTSKVVFICRPCNPTGETVNLETLRELAQATNTNGSRDLLIIDEAYGDFLPDEESAVKLVEEYENIIVLRSLSKGIGLSGMRLGYAIVSPGRLSQTWQQCMDLVFAIGGDRQLIAEMALQPNIFKDFLPRIREQTLQIKSYFIEKLTSLGINVFPTDLRVPIMLVQVPNCPNFASFMARYGMIVESGKDFKDVDPKMNDSMARIRIPSCTEKVEEAIRRIEILLEEARENPGDCFVDS